MKQFAVIRIRGVNRVNQKVERTLQQLHLYRKNYCSVVPETPSYIGMLEKIKDMVTYGPIDEETYKLLVEKKGEDYVGPTSDSSGKIDYSGKYVEINKKKYKHFFRLSPPRGGFERKGIKNAYSIGGVLGFRKDGLKKLLMKMI